MTCKHRAYGKRARIQHSSLTADNKLIWGHALRLWDCVGGYFTWRRGEVESEGAQGSVCIVYVISALN